MNQQFGNQIGRFGTQGGFNQGFTQGAGQQQLNAQVQRIQQATISGEESNPLRGAGFAGGFGSTGMMNQGNFTSSGATANFGNAQGGFGQAVSQQQLNRIHQNSIFNGASQLDNAQIQRIQQATISGEEPNPLSAGFGGGFGGGFAQNNVGGGFGNAQAGFGAAGNLMNQGNFGSGQAANFGNGQGGFGQGVSQQQLNQIHQNSIFNGQSQPDNMQVQRIHQATISGEEGNPLSAGFGGGFGAASNFAGGFGATANFGNVQAGFGSAQAGFGAASNLVNQGNFGNGQSANFGNAQGGFNQAVSQQQLNQIHQNSIFNGQSQPDNAHVQRIHQATISGEESNPLSAGFGGGFAQNNFGNAQAGFGSMQAGFGAAGNMMNQGNFGSGATANFGNGQGFGQAVSQQQLNQIHQNSIFNGASQQDNAQVQRIQQATISGEESNPLRAGFGGGANMGMMMGGQQGMMSMMGGQGRQGGQNQGFVNPSMLNAVLNADAGILDQQGPNRYPASMYTGSNQYDNVNQSVFNQLTRGF